jgi:hypothetical protein
LETFGGGKEFGVAIRSNHYDRAFEEFLRGRGTPHVVVDEQRRATLAHDSLKSMDFIVHSLRGANLLVDVKGRRFPSGGEGRGHTWENWATEDDLTSLVAWQGIFGSGFRAMLVFAYEVVDDRYLDRFPELFAFRDRRYGFFGVAADEYAEVTRTRSASWGTVGAPRAAFQRLRRPIAEFL